MAIKSRIRLNQIQDEVGDLAVGQGGAHASEANLQDVLLNLSDMLERRFGIDKLTGTSAAADSYGSLFAERAEEGAAIIYAFGRSDDMVIRNNGSGAVDIDSAAGIDIDAAGALSLAGAAASDLSISDGGLTITSAATADDMDTVVSHTGAFDASLLVSSTGTGSDALSLSTSVGGMVINSADVLDIDAAANATFNSAAAVEITGGTASFLKATTEDLTVEAVAASLNLLAAEADSAAISIQASAGGIDMDAATIINIDSAHDSSTGDAAIEIIASGTEGMISSTATDYYITASRELMYADSVDALGNAQNLEASFQYDSVDNSQTKISLTNKTGSGGSAVKLEAAAGGVAVSAVKKFRTSSERAHEFTAGLAETVPGTFDYALSIAGASTANSLAYGADGFQADLDDADADDQKYLRGTMWFEDVHAAGGDAWAVGQGLALSAGSDEWDQYRSAFGEVSLLGALAQAAVGSADAFHMEFEVVNAAGIPADSDLFQMTYSDQAVLANATNSPDVIVLDEEGTLVTANAEGASLMGAGTSLAELKERIEVYVNGQRMSGAFADYDIASLHNGNAEQLNLDFNFDLEEGDIVIIKA